MGAMNVEIHRSPHMIIAQFTQNPTPSEKEFSNIINPYRAYELPDSGRSIARTVNFSRQTLGIAPLDYHWPILAPWLNFFSR